MHNPLKLFFVLFLCFLCSCSKNSGVETKKDIIADNNDKYNINCETFSIEHNSENAEMINSVFAEELEEWLENFKERAAQIKVQGSSPPTLQVRHTIKNNTKTILSVTTEKYVYLSGLHGNTWVSAKNYSAEQDKLLSLSDLFSDKEYKDILTQRIEELIENNPDTYHDLWEKPCVDGSREDKFYIEGKNLVIFFEPYELSYYARGVVEFPIPLEKIRGYIKPEYLPS